MRIGDRRSELGDRDGMDGVDLMDGMDATGLRVDDLGGGLCGLGMKTNTNMKTNDSTTNNSVEHTPGPWIFEELNTGGDMNVWAPGDDGDGRGRQLFCRVNVGWGKNAVAVAQANARLMAAAPDLLAALLSAEKWLAAAEAVHLSARSVDVDGARAPYEADRAAIRAALAKALGTAVLEGTEAAG